MPKIEIDRERCKGCELCVLYCPKSLIKLETAINKRGVHPAKFSSKEGCTGCSFCALICPDLAIEVYR